MKTLKKNCLFFVIASVVLLPQQELRANSIVKNIVFCLGGATAFGVIGALIYNAWRTPTDCEELSKGQQPHYQEDKPEQPQPPPPSHSPKPHTS